MSTAGAMGLVALLAAAVVVWRVVGEEPAFAASPICSQAVTVERAGGVRLGCVGEPALAGCPAYGVGDALQLRDGVCQVQPQGMDGRARLLAAVPLDLNRATASELQLLDGIGPKTAAAIEQWRQTHGVFARVEELLEVRGVGPATLAKLRPHVTVVSR